MHDDPRDSLHHGPPPSGPSPAVPPPIPKSDRADAEGSLRAARFVNLLCPGLGHLLVGRWRRGLVFLVLFLILAGGGLAAGVAAVVQVYVGVFRSVSSPAAALPRVSPRLLLAALGGIAGSVILIIWSVCDLRKDT